MQDYVIKLSNIKDQIDFLSKDLEKGWVETVQDLIKRKPFGNYPFYIHQFMKRVDDISGVKKLYHHARLTKPDPTPGATLIKVYPLEPERLKLCWTVPNEGNLALFKEGKIFEDEEVYGWCRMYLNNQNAMIAPDHDDLNDDAIKHVYREIRGEILHTTKFQKI